MKSGDKGEAVKLLQTNLAWLGYKVDIDGSYGPQTSQAVRNFQGYEGLIADGIAGPVTLARLDVLVQQPTSGFDNDGWLWGARKCVLHSGRMGGKCNAAGCVVHSTDTFGGMAAILETWATTPGKGNAAHFLVGRRAATPKELTGEHWPSAGLVQMAPVYRNANHAGGPLNSHGWIVKGTTKMHPNSWYVGIEVDNAGGLIRKGLDYIHKDSGKVMPLDQVYVDASGRGWHKYTAYQFEQVGVIIDAVLSLGNTFPAGSVLVSNGTYLANGVPWAKINELRVMTHAALDPQRKTDPGAEMTAWLNARYK